MSDLIGPPVSHDDYRLHVRVLSPIVRRVPADDRPDILQNALARAVRTWDPTRSPWGAWLAIVLRGEVDRYFRDRWPGRTPFPDDLPAHDTLPQIIARIDLGLLFAHLSPRQRRAVAAQNGGGAAHRARLRLRQLASRNPQEVSQ